MKTSTIERYGTAAFVIGSIIGTYLFSRPKKSGTKTKLDRRQQRKIDRNLMTPANATFGIVWPVLYSGAVALAIHQALPSEQGNPRYTKARPWLLACYAMNGVFGYFFSKSDKKNRIGAAITTIAMLPASILLHRQLRIGDQAVTEPENSIHKVMGMYSGWLTAASAVSITTLLQETGFLTSKEATRKFAFYALPVTSGAALLVSNKLNDPYYLIPVAAAQAGIALKQKDNNQYISAVAATLAAGLTGIVVDKTRELRIPLESLKRLL